MSDELFPGAQPPAVVASAALSTDGLYRWTLTRTWGDGPTATFIMLNPSTADGTKDDPTVRRCLGFARSLGCTRLVVANLFAWRATDPDDLAAAYKAGRDIVGGPDADQAITTAVDGARIVIGAWGAGPAAVQSAMAARISDVRALTGSLYCLGTTRSGQPRHPLYLPASSALVPWPAGATEPQETP